MFVNLHAIEQTQLRRQHRVDGVRCDFHTAPHSMRSYFVSTYLGTLSSSSAFFASSRWAFSASAVICAFASATAAAS